MQIWRMSMIIAALSLAAAQAARALDMMDQVDLSSPMFTTAEMTRADIEAALKAAAGLPLISRARASTGLISQISISPASISARRERTRRISPTAISAARCWIRSLRLALIFPAQPQNAHLFASQMRNAKFDGADLSGARVPTADMTHASLRGARFKGADLSADIKNQVDGADARHTEIGDTGADFKARNLGRDNMQFADLRGANFTGASLTPADASGADLRSAITANVADLTGIDIASAQIGKAQDEAFAKAKNRARAISE